MVTIQKHLAHLFHPRRSNNHRPRVLHPEALGTLVGVLIITVSLFQVSRSIPQTGQVLGFASSITPEKVINETNLEREKLGLNSLSSNQVLNTAAMAKAQDMMNHQYWAHVAPDGRQPWDFIHEAGYSYSVAGENLARDFQNTDTMVAAWMASPTHRANILQSKYTDIGIAVVDGNLQGYETTLVVQMFGKPKTVVAGSTETTLGESSLEPVISQDSGQPKSSTVLAGALVPHGSFQAPPLLTPLQLSKALFLSLIMLVMATLLYDAFVIGHRDTMRLVGKNLAHILFLSAITYLVLFFKAGIIG